MPGQPGKPNDERVGTTDSTAPAAGRYQGTISATSRKPMTTRVIVRVLLVAKRLRPEEWGTAPGGLERGMLCSLIDMPRP